LVVKKRGRNTGRGSDFKRAGGEQGDFLLEAV